MTERRKPRILLVDDQPTTVEWASVLLTAEGYEVRTETAGAAGRTTFRAWRPDLVMFDLWLPDTNGLELLRWFKGADETVELIIVTGHGSVPQAVEAIKAGAYTFVEKPVEPDTLRTVVERALERRVLHVEHQRLGRQLSPAVGDVIGKSKVMSELMELVDSVAGSEANILIQGENGTGKELIANAIHARSKRAAGPFIKINCAAIPKELIESELFGYKKGAFTGAAADKRGLLELAQGGSLLLDEIGEMPPYVQTKLLRVLQEREFRPVGSDRVVQVDFRLICATNVDVEAALRDGRLREDLYFRINTITITVPPLREHTEDIPLLCEYFLQKYNGVHERRARSIAPAAYHLLMRHRWSGNVRELENAIERAVLVAHGPELGVNDLPDTIRDVGPRQWELQIPPNCTLAEIERMAILQTLQRTNWNKQEAAQILGLYRPTLYSKMRKHAIFGAGRAARHRPTGDLD